MRKNNTMKFLTVCPFSKMNGVEELHEHSLQGSTVQWLSKCWPRAREAGTTREFVRSKRPTRALPNLNSWSGPSNVYFPHNLWDGHDIPPFVQMEKPRPRGARQITQACTRKCHQMSVHLRVPVLGGLAGALLHWALIGRVLRAPSKSTCILHAAWPSLCWFSASITKLLIWEMPFQHSH